MCHPIVRSLGICLIGFTSASAQNLFYSDSVSFSGNWAAYNSLSDAQSNVGAVAGGIWGAQPTVLFYDGTQPNNIIETAFYALPANVPFMAAFDPTLATLASTSVRFDPLDLSVNIFQSGATTGGTSRLDPTGALPIAQSGGDWFGYSLDLKATGIVFPDPNGGPPFSSFSNPSAVSGTFSGIFHRTGGDGLYLTLNLTGAFGGARALGQAINPTDAFTSQTIPEGSPGASAAVILTVAGWFAIRRNPNRRSL